MTELTKDNFFQFEQQFIERILMKSDLRGRSEDFTRVMDKARELDLEQDAFKLAQNIASDLGEPELWELPEPFVSDVQYQPFPTDCLPKVCADYLRAVCRFVQVSPDMAVLPLLSVLSLCVQGKALVRYPANSHTESLNLYTITVAPPGERKSGVFKALIRPVEQFESRFNELHRHEIAEYRSKLQFLEHQKQSAMSGKNASLERVQELTKEISDLEPVSEMKLICCDTTPEALAFEMQKQKGRMAVMDDEGSVFDVISGIYTGGMSNINLFLKAYDGSAHTIFRRTSENITVDNPYLTFGIMTQPVQFFQSLSNPQFLGRGLMYRFLFAFPKGMAGEQNFASEDIPEDVRNAYDSLIERLLSLPDSDVQICHDDESFGIFQDYFGLLQSKMKESGMFADMKEYASKHFGKVLRIAGLLHLCEHEPEELINAQTAINAVSIGLWAENMALKALGSGLSGDECTRNANYIVRRLRELDVRTTTLRELKRSCRAVNGSEAFEQTVELLEDKKYIRLEKTGTKSNSKVICHINPCLFNA